MPETTILTNDRVIEFGAWAITALGTALILVLVFIFKMVMKEIKGYRTDALNQRAEFNNTMNNKFKSINYYMRQTDKLQVKQEQHIDHLLDHARDTKAKLLKHEEKLNNYGEKLASHEIKIENLKKTG